MTEEASNPAGVFIARFTKVGLATVNLYSYKATLIVYLTIYICFTTK
jgi:hypothetical protein